MDVEDVLGGRYRLVERLGEGGMAVVWRANDEVLRREVAIKLLSPGLLADSESRARIRAEAQAVAQLSHPHIAGVYDYGESERSDGAQIPYVVMELLSGPTLAQLLKEGPVPARAALRLCAEVAAALAAAHQRGIVHRDVKPANIMMTAVGAKVVDFGVAAVIGELTDQHPEGMLYGTPAYVSPERLEGTAAVPGTDVYALGVLMYRLLAGHMPWSAESITQLLRAHLYTEPDPLPRMSGVSAEVADVCARCLAKDPLDRPTAAELARILAGSIGASVPTNDGSGPAGLNGRRHSPAPLPVRRPLAPVETPAPPVVRRGRERVLAVTAAAGVLVAIGAVAAAGWWPDAVGPLNAARDPASSTSAGARPGTGEPGAPDGPGNNGTGTGNGSGTEAGPGIDPNAGAGGGILGTDPDTLFETPGATPSVTPSQPTYGGSDATPTPSPTSAAPVVVSEQAVRSEGGSALVRCTGSEGELLDKLPNDGYVTGAYIPGPARTVGVRFRPNASVDPSTALPIVTIAVRCTDGVALVRIKNG